MCPCVRPRVQSKVCLSVCVCVRARAYAHTQDQRYYVRITNGIMCMCMWDTRLGQKSGWLAASTATSGVYLCILYACVSMRVYLWVCIYACVSMGILSLASRVDFPGRPYTCRACLDELGPAIHLLLCCNTLAARCAAIHLLRAVLRCMCTRHGQGGGHDKRRQHVAKCVGGGHDKRRQHVNVDKPKPETLNPKCSTAWWPSQAART